MFGRNDRSKFVLYGVLPKNDEIKNGKVISGCPSSWHSRSIMIKCTPNSDPLIQPLSPTLTLTLTLTLILILILLILILHLRSTDQPLFNVCYSPAWNNYVVFHCTSTILYIRYVVTYIFNKADKTRHDPCDAARDLEWCEPTSPRVGVGRFVGARRCYCISAGGNERRSMRR